VSTGADREGARRALADACGGTQVTSIKTNAWFLKRLLDHQAFAVGKVTTGFIAEHEDELTQASVSDAVRLAAVSWRLEEFMAAEAEGDHAIAPQGLFGFRLNAERAPARLALDVDGETQAIVARPSGAGNDWRWDVAIDGRADFDVSGSLPTTFGPCAENEPDGDILLFEEGFAHTATFGPQRGLSGASAADGAILAPMPGKVIAVDVAEGEAVAKGQRLMVLEAMKMEHALTAPFDGTVAKLTASEGQQVQVEALLARVEKADT